MLSMAILMEKTRINVYSSTGTSKREFLPRFPDPGDKEGSDPTYVLHPINNRIIFSIVKRTITLSEEIAEDLQQVVQVRGV